MLSDSERPTFTILPAMRSQSLACGRCFIDGTLSKMYRKGGSVPWQYHPFVTMITVGENSGARLGRPFQPRVNKLTTRPGKVLLPCPMSLVRWRCAYRALQSLFAAIWP